MTVEPGQLRQWRHRIGDEVEPPMFLVVSIVPGHDMIKRKMWPEYTAMVGWTDGVGVLEYDGLEWVASNSDVVE